VGNNIPVFFIQDVIKFPDLIHSAKQEPDRGFPQAQTAHDNFWDFISLTPESINMALWIMSDRTIPRSLRFMEGFGVHTFRLVNAEGQSHFVKFHWKPKQGLQSVVWNEALKLNGADPDFHRRDMWNAIKMGDFPEWELGIQVFDDKFAEEFEFDVLDATKIIPEEQVPVRIIGRMVLNRCVDNFFAETEQVAFQTGSLVPGIDFSNDPLLQGRNFSYLDTQLSRLGSTNFTHLPIYAPRCPFHHFQQDGHMAFHNPTGRANYEPNSWGEEGGPREDPEKGFKSYPEHIGASKGRYRSETFADHYSQARQFYRSQTDTEKGYIADAFIFELSKVEVSDVRERIVSHLLNVDEALAEQVMEGLRIKSRPKAADAALAPRDDLKKSSKLSIIRNGPNSFAGRKLGALVTDGVDIAIVEGLKAALEKEGAQIEFIAPHIAGVEASDGTWIEAQQKIDGGPSVLYDAVAILVSDDGAKSLAKMPPSRDFVAVAFAHCKFIAYTKEAETLFEKAGILSELDKGCQKITKKSNAKSFVETCRQIRFWERESKLA
jgi:catalase